jgi:hypothetical protein
VQALATYICPQLRQQVLSKSQTQDRVLAPASIDSPTQEAVSKGLSAFIGMLNAAFIRLFIHSKNKLDKTAKLLVELLALGNVSDQATVPVATGYPCTRPTASNCTKCPLNAFGKQGPASQTWPPVPEGVLGGWMFEHTTRSDV